MRKQSYHLINQPKEDLKREITLWGLSANLVNIMIGAGIFVLPALVAAKLGTASILAYFVCGLLVSLVMLCFAEAGSRVTETGGPYSYIEEAFGKYAGFLAANFFLLSALFSDGAVSNAVVDILKTFFPILDQWIYRTLVMFMIFGGLTLINVLGIKQGIGLVKFITLVKLIPILVLIVMGWTEVDPANLAWEETPEFSNLLQTSLLLFFAFQGAESGLTVSGEVKNPSRIIPRAIFVAIFGVLFIYVMIQVVSQGVLGDTLGDYTESPLAEVAGRIFGPWGFTFLTIAAAISMFGTMSSEILSLPRMLYGAARDNIIPPKSLSKIHPKYKTPYIAIIVYAGTGFILSIVGNFKYLAVMSSSFILLLYLGVVLSIFNLRKTTSAGKGVFVIPGGYTVPVAAAVVVIILLFGLNQNELLGGLVSIAILSVVFLLTKKLRSSD
ncbi:APC family permease [Fulvivirga sedimenti]|uniref:APC family permease n=1 Tax=Fulvivirga sedimenti TaxID=2879465 RepID=A0A9X1HRV5_9BACT|nr:amino acid permease [Fulvivirga sedimenti]MCA6075642.1 APC family permease [Fulvivirga sedimenti]